jgi:hypothetical protein
MRGCRSLPLAVGLLLLGGTSSAAATPERPPRVLFSFADPAIDESSGLVDAGPVVHTVNDSGDGPRIYTVDKRTGRTVATTTYTSDEVVDVEALAPGRRGGVWVGDTGDNRAVRPSVAVYRVPVLGDRVGSRVGSTRFDLVYPDSAHDAEALLVHPRTGRLFVVSKALLAGTVFRAPATLRPGRLNRLTAVAAAPGLVTDGAFLPDGRHLVLRDYRQASVYTFPGFRLLRTVTLPPQDQGEGIAVSPAGEVTISTEGAHSAVQQVFLPALPDPVPQNDPPGSANPAPPGSVDPALSDSENPASGPGWAGGDGAWFAAGLLALGAAGAVYLRAARRRSPRRW